MYRMILHVLCRFCDRPFENTPSFKNHPNHFNHNNNKFPPHLSFITTNTYRDTDIVKARVSIQQLKRKLLKLINNEKGNNTNLLVIMSVTFVSQWMLQKANDAHPTKYSYNNIHILNNTNNNNNINNNKHYKIKINSDDYFDFTKPLRKYNILSCNVKCPSEYG